MVSAITARINDVRDLLVSVILGFRTLASKAFHREQMRAA